MHLFTFIKPKLSFKNLAQIKDSALFEKCVELVTAWFTEQWGYIHDRNKSPEQAFKTRKEYLKENASKIHIVFYDKLIVGAFRIEEKEFDEKLLKKDKLQTSEIWFIYVDPNCRSLSIGRQIVQEIKRLSKEEMKTGMVLLETLKPGLNHLYMTENGKLICENSLDGNPTDVIKIGL